MNITVTNMLRIGVVSAPLTYCVPTITSASWISMGADEFDGTKS